jgi:hypothetical protein
MNPRPYSAKVLALCGLILIRMGLYLILLRSALLPEDIRYIGTCLCTSGWLARGARGAGNIRGGVRSVCRHYPCVLPTPGLS